jgi:RNA polymerase sigma-70 factor (ECF subfamily)
VDANVGVVGTSAETELLARAADGDNVAFDRLLGPRLDRLYRIARGIVSDDAAAGDVLQEGCVRAWRQLGALRDPDRFDAWLTQIVVNQCRTHLGRRRVRAVREIRMDTPDGGRTADRSSSGTLGDDVVDSEAIRRAFRRLDADKRTLLVLHYVESRPLSEIASALGIPAGTVKWRLSRAREALERALEAER